MSSYGNPLQSSLHSSDIILVNNGLILIKIKQSALKSGYNFSTYDKFTDTSWIEELQTIL